MAAPIAPAVVKEVAMKELKGTEKRNFLVDNEKKCQIRWAEEKTFQSNAPTLEDIPFQSISNDEMHSKHPKFFGLMAYPYMNGTLHAGHTLTISKVEFATGFARMQGKRALFPMGYHCTGMAIKASADKLAEEVKKFGKNFEGYSEEIDIEELAITPAAVHVKEDITKFKSKKGKTAGKTIKKKYQFQIMESINVPKEEIHKFADAQHWFGYFPILCRNDLTNMGARIDWRRQMVTTNANPYYDSFVRWQMNRLKELGKIKFGKRYTVYSAKDKQPCMDHDRSDGEGVTPQEYTAIKLQVKTWSKDAASALEGKLPNDAKVFFVAATLRPETMYGQTCCFVGPTITYGVYKTPDGSYFVIVEKAARNMAFQNILADDGSLEKVTDILGSACVGTLVDAALSVHTEGVYILPMETVLATKGTGVVTCVPSDSPDDYATTMELQKKPERYGIEKAWASKEIVSVITTPAYGDFAAEALVKELKISSPKDTKQLEEAKERAYKEGFYKGIMNIGEYKGQKVEDAKDLVKEMLFAKGFAFRYAEPERKVTSRSGDDCIVAWMDQWYLDYGEETWRDEALGHVANTDGKGLETYSDEVKNQFEKVLHWLNQWACARAYGHGSKLPWDPNFMVESLSDSTIYMAYYTVSHFLHGDAFGKTQGLAKLQPEQLTDEVWDFLFARADIDDNAQKASGIDRTTLERMRREFEYWYPVDVNVSGKDLVANHLTMFIYIHIAIWNKQQEFWPRSIRSNGHLLLNGDKMAKSTGNFMTLNELISKYGADASRVAIADAGDGSADANFEEDVADSAILRLYNLREWCYEQLSNSKLRTGAADNSLDKMFLNEMSGIVYECYAHYEATNYKLALKSALYDFTAARDFYREATAASGVAMHQETLATYVEWQALLLAVIAPHWAESIWTDLLKKPSSIQAALWPQVPVVDEKLRAAREYIRVTSSNITSAEAAQQKKKAKGKAIGLDNSKPKKVTIFVATEFPEWQQEYIDVLQRVWETKSADMEAQLIAELKTLNGPEKKKGIPFVQMLKKRLVAGEPSGNVFNRELVFNETEVLQGMIPLLKRAAGLASVSLVEIVKDADKKQYGVAVSNGAKTPVEQLEPVALNPIPGSPTFFFENEL